MPEPSPELAIIPAQQPTFYFIGVTTGKSSIRKIFPLWAAALGRPEVVLEGVDLKLHDRPEAYRQAVAQIKYDPLSPGGLVTTHKLAVVAAARDLFDYLDPYATLCEEVSCISKAANGPEEGRLEGHAKDPLTAGASLDAILGPGYFGHTGGEVLCLGAGGAALAIALHLINKPQAADRPRRFIVVNRSAGRLEALRSLVERVGSDIAFDYICNEDPSANDETMAALPPGSVVINATGMGKDRPGSPITNIGPFPLDGIAWELNYRGELDFLHQAEAQREARRLRVEDGWLYFLYGWTQVIAQVFHRPIEGELFQELARLAESVR
jgi:shikimate dehydrogenase